MSGETPTSPTLKQDEELYEYLEHILGKNPAFQKHASILKRSYIQPLSPITYETETSYMPDTRPESSRPSSTLKQDVSNAPKMSQSPSRQPSQKQTSNASTTRSKRSSKKPMIYIRESSAPTVYDDADQSIESRTPSRHIGSSRQESPSVSKGGYSSSKRSNSIKIQHPSISPSMSEKISSIKVNAGTIRDQPVPDLAHDDFFIGDMQDETLSQDLHTYKTRAHRLATVDRHTSSPPTQVADNIPWHVKNKLYNFQAFVHKKHRTRFASTRSVPQKSKSYPRTTHWHCEEWLLLCVVTMLFLYVYALYIEGPGGIVNIPPKKPDEIIQEPYTTSMFSFFGEKVQSTENVKDPIKKDKASGFSLFG